MQNDRTFVIFGGLLHDIGKPVQRSLRDPSLDHSKAGVDFLKKAGCTEKAILDQVRYHHSDAVRSADLPDDSLAYITYIADNMASGADRRKTGDGVGFDLGKALGSVFNIINGNNGSACYLPLTMNDKKGINYPNDGETKFSRETYSSICDELSDGLRGIEYNETYANSLLELLEADCSYIPSSTSKDEIADISLYDHVKITAAVGICIYDYLNDNGETDFRSALYRHSSDFYEKNAFLMYSFDVSGIQDFIYSISSVESGSGGTLKLLRARSFYLEMLCEHYTDTLLSRLGISRANLIYSGGGHGYLLLPNTEHVKSALNELHTEMNEWLMENFKTALYIAAAYTPCTANDLMNSKDKGGNYEDIFKRLSRKLSDEKRCKYSAEDIMRLNSASGQSDERECRICHGSYGDIHDNKCGTCSALIDFSDDILKKDFFAVVHDEDGGLPLPFGCRLVGTSREELTSKKLMGSEKFVRSYCKNKQYTGKDLSTKLWVGDYNTDREFSKLAKKSEGIERIGIIRADVDNLGSAFTSGFSDKYTSLSRTATFSRAMSIFFKHHINTLLREKNYNAVIIYSGGDDIFMVTSWTDAVPAALTLRDAFARFTQGMLTISAGVGMYSPGYPVAAMARESGNLESASKNKGRNKITIFSDNTDGPERYTLDWDELKNDILGTKTDVLKEYFDAGNEHGRAMLYNLTELLRDTKHKINIARLAYLLGRMEPDKDSSAEDKVRHDRFAHNIYSWALDEKNRNDLIIAIYLYIYMTRETKESEQNELC